jgi:ribonuclease HI
MLDMYTLYFDGSCGPINPRGTAAYGYTLHRVGQKIKEGHAIIGTGEGMSNNLAEFSGLAAGLQEFMTLVSGAALLNVRGDSQVVINIMNRSWKARSNTLYWPAYVDADGWLREIRRKGVQVSFDWIPREQNTECDKLSKCDASH